MFKYDSFLEKNICKIFAKMWKKNIFSTCDKFVCMSYQKEYYINEKAEVKKKIIYSDIPLFKLQVAEIAKNSGRRNWLYVGTVDKKARNPEKLCSFFKKFSDENVDTISFFTNGVCDDLIKSIIEEKNMELNGYVSHSEIEKIIETSDILLSIGNTGEYSSMLPSKIFEYMSYNKKIIHFFEDDNDKAIRYLNRYKNSLLVDVRRDFSSIDKNVIEEFLNSEVVAGEYLEEEFYRNNPDYTAKIFKGDV